MPNILTREQYQQMAEPLKKQLADLQQEQYDESGRVGGSLNDTPEGKKNGYLSIILTLLKGSICASFKPVG